MVKMKVIQAFLLYFVSLPISLAGETLTLEYKITIKGPDGNRTAYLADEQVAYTGTAQAFWGNGQIKTKYSLIDGKKNGPSLSWYGTGKSWMEGNYTAGRKSGLWTYWRENGQKKMEVVYENNQPNGLYRWYENGRRKWETTVRQGKWHGTFTEWDPAGNKKEERIFEMGKANGPWTKWYGNGVREEGFYKNGKKHGDQVHFASDGSEISRVSYKDGYRVDKE